MLQDTLIETEDYTSTYYKLRVYWPLQPDYTNNIIYCIVRHFHIQLDTMKCSIYYQNDTINCTAIYY